ncbi:MAG: galactokinase [Solirubrobacteraceae bacterium]|nr:galactokinase [Solirubrobacteraceae bacterium]
MRTTAFAPGRVNLIGEHTDYNAGFALPFAIARGVTVRTTPLPGGMVMARATDLHETDNFNADDPGHADGWRAFVRGTVAELGARAARIEISGDVPRGGGLSSSAAFGAALALALCGEDDPDRRALARLCSKVENEWVGAQTGLLDQYASLLAIERHALLIDFAHDTVEPVPVEVGGWQFVVVRAGAPHDHAEGGYNDRRRECQEAAERLDVHTLRWATAEAAEQLEEPWRSRALHVITENERVLAAVDALRAADLVTLAALLDASHASLRDRFAVSTDAVERVVDRLRASGAMGARLIGGGFGGHVLALYPPGARLPSGSLTVTPSAGATVRSA